MATTPVLEPYTIYDCKVPEDWTNDRLFYAYDLEISANQSVTIEIGRFSHSLLKRIFVVGSRVTPTVLKVGSFCEAAGNTSIQLGGEHRNDDLFNFSFGSNLNDHFRPFMTPLDLELSSPMSRPLTIGDNVIISRSATLTSSADVGSGCVIGAGALVVGSCEPLGIYGGVPARRIKERFDQQTASLYKSIDLPNIAAHFVPSLPARLSALKAGEISIDEFRSSVGFLPARPKIHLHAVISSGMVSIKGVTGFSIGGAPVTDTNALEILARYFNQTPSSSQTVKWSPDIFRKLDLY